LLQFLTGKVSDRKLRLFAVACCRRILDDDQQPIGQDSVHPNIPTAEGVADRRIGKGALIRSEAIAAWPAHWGGAHGARSYVIGAILHENALAAVRSVANHVAIYFAHRTRERPPSNTEDAQQAYRDAAAAERGRQANLFREILGNPFRPVIVDPAWLTRTVVEVAQATYDQRAFDRMPILADALEDAGCTHTDILEHCRQPGEHVRGCWVIDSLLNKS
jgi:hypothetical protein